MKITIPKEKKIGIFNAYQTYFLARRQETKGFKNANMNQEEKQKYVEDFYKENMIQLDINRIEKNDSMNLLTKLSINSIYGRIGMSPRNTKQVILNNVWELEIYINTGLFKILDIYFASDDGKIFVSYKCKKIDNKYCDFRDEKPQEIEKEANRYTNYLLSSHISAYGRILLNRFISQIPDHNLLYVDTDGIIYVEDKAKFTLPTANALGALSNEIDKLEPRDQPKRIVEYVSSGPKSYALCIQVGEKYDPKNLIYILKNKGFQFSFCKNQELSYEMFVALCTGDVDRICIKYSKIEREKFFKLVTNHEYTKDHKFSLNKRVQIANPQYSTYPYGDMRIENT